MQRPMLMFPSASIRLGAAAASDGPTNPLRNTANAISDTVKEGLSGASKETNKRKWCSTLLPNTSPY